MTRNRTGARRNGAGLQPEQRLLEELYRQRTELGEIATELISLLEAAGVESHKRSGQPDVGSSS
jgi:hypothetical protein